MKNYDPFAATQIRIIAGIFGYILLVTMLARWNMVSNASHNKSGMILTSVGAFFGPFLGVSFSLIAIKYTEAGIASTIMALVPIFIILPAFVLFKQKVTLSEILGSIVSVGGVALFFL
jgi:drug/metabolite transporter (DMT)-like permease